MVSGVTIPDGKNYLVDNVTTGTIKLNNHCNITGGDYVVRNNAADGKIYIDNSTITGTASYAYVVYPNNGGQMYISNSEINAPAGYCVYVGGSSSTPYVDINNYIDDTKGFICNSKTNLSYAAHVTVSNCTFDGGTNGVTNGMAAYRDPSGAQSWDITLDHLVAAIR